MKLVILLLAITAYVAARSTMCYSNGDPHFRSFSGKKFDNQYVGTILMAKTTYFEVQEKTIVWNKRTSVNQATGIKVGGHRVILSHRYNQAVKIDGRSYTLRNGRNVIRGIRFDKHGSRVFVRRGREYVSVQVNYNRKWAKYGSTQYQNIAVFGRSIRAGICGNHVVRTGRGIWRSPRTITKVVASSHCTRRQHNVASAHCYKRFGTKKGKFYQWCLYDTCRGLRAKWAASYSKQLKYWRAVMKKYNVYLRNHRRLADIYYKRSLKHLEHMKVHSAKYRAHARAARRLRRNGRSHQRAYRAHIRAARSHKNSAHVHRRHSNAHYRAYRIYKYHATQWRKRIAHAKAQIKKCQENIKKKNDFIKTAEGKISYYVKLSNNHLKAYYTHKSAAATHHKHALKHSRIAVKHLHAGRKAYKKANWHKKMTTHHLNMRNHHSRHANANKRAHIAHKNSAHYWVKKIRSASKKVKQLTKIWQAQFKNEVKVVKTIQVRSRSCESTPRYLDNIKFCSSSYARKRALRRCQHRDRFVTYSCVFDHARGIFHTKNQYARLAARLRNNRKSLTCASTGDPHNKPFIGRNFNVYNVKGWRVLLRKKFTVWTHMSFTKTWGRRAINTWVQTRINGKISLFQPRGVLREGKGFDCDWKRTVDTRHRAQWTKRVGSSTITVSWHGHGKYPAGYYNVFIKSNKGAMANCSGDCCNAHTKVSRITRRDGNPRHVRFRSKCGRKTTAFRVCAYAYRNFSGKRKVRAIQRCVAARKHL